MKRNDTYWTSLQACDHYFKETGAIPTIVAIRDRIGINSPNIISQAIKDFKGSLADQVVKARKDLSGIPLPVVHIAVDLWEAAKAEAFASASQRLEELGRQEQAVAEKERQMTAELEQSRQMIKQLSEELDQAHAKIYQAEEYLAQLENKAQAELQTQLDRYNQFEARLSVVSNELAQEKQLRINAEVAYEKQNNWAMKRIAEEKNILEQRYTKELNQLKSTVHKLKNDNQMLQARLAKVSDSDAE